MQGRTLNNDAFAGEFATAPNAHALEAERCEGKKSKENKVNCPPPPGTGRVGTGLNEPFFPEEKKLNNAAQKYAKKYVYAITIQLQETGRVSNSISVSEFFSNGRTNSASAPRPALDCCLGMQQPVQLPQHLHLDLFTCRGRQQASNFSTPSQIVSEVPGSYTSLKTPVRGCRYLGTPTKLAIKERFWFFYCLWGKPPMRVCKNAGWECFCEDFPIHNNISGDIFLKTFHFFRALLLGR